MRFKKIILILLMALIIVFIGCSKKKTTQPEPTNATVNVSLSTSDGGSVVGAVVRLSHNTYTAHSFVRTSTGNTVTFGNVPFGTYTLTVSRSGYDTFMNTNVSIQSESVSQSVTLQVITNSITIVNNIGIYIFGGVLLNTGTTILANCFLPNGLTNGALFTMSLPQNQINFVSIQLFGTNNSVYQFSGTIPEDRIIVFTSLNHNRTFDVSTPLFKIRNDTGENTETILRRINMMGSSDLWQQLHGIVGNATALLNGSEIIVTGLNHSHITSVDYRLRTPAGVTYTKLNVSPTVGATIIFTSSDRD